MKIGSQDRVKVVVLVALMLLAALVFFWPSGKKPAPAAATTDKGKKGPAAVSTLDPTLRFDLLSHSESRKYAGSGRNIFEFGYEPPPPPVVPKKTPAQVEAEKLPPPPPPPPPINLKFYGFASKPGESKKIFLSSGEDIFIASEGEVVNRRYRIVKIMTTSVEIEDTLNNNKQTIPLTQS